MDQSTLKTARLVLMKITPNVMEDVYTRYSLKEQMTFWDTTDLSKIDKEKEKWKKNLTTHNKSFVYFHLLDRQTNKIIGWCGFHTWYTDHDRAELGYGLYKEEIKGKGLMSEALQVILAYGFQEMKLHRIEAFTAIYNIASIRILEKFHFQKEGVMKEHYFWEGKYEDSVIYSLIKV